MMDEMKIKLSTRFMKNIISKLITKAICNKLGYKINIQLTDLDVSFVGGETKIITSAEVTIDKNEFEKIIKTVIKE